MVELTPKIRPVLTVKEAAAADRRRERVTTLYDDINAGRFPALRRGRVIRMCPSQRGSRPSVSARLRRASWRESMPARRDVKDDGDTEK